MNKANSHKVVNKDQKVVNMIVHTAKRKLKSKSTILAIANIVMILNSQNLANIAHTIPALHSAGWNR